MNPNAYLSLARMPDVVRVFGSGQSLLSVTKGSNGTYVGDRFCLSITVVGDKLKVGLTGNGVARIQLRWHGDQSGVRSYLGDHWERSYGDLEWRGECAGRVMPWYFLASDGHLTHGYGVEVGASGLCFWMADSAGISFWADVRSGGVPVESGSREIDVATIISRQGKPNESAFDAATSLCRLMCPSPRLPKAPIHGTNDWPFAYGNNSANLIYRVSGLISDLSPSWNNRPFSLIDEGWAMGPFNGTFGFGPWEANPNFGDMAKVANHLNGIGVRPGIWYRPLTVLPDTPESWKLSRDATYTDPTIPEVLEQVKSEISKFVGWGYEMIKHDFTTWDICGKWGFQMGASVTNDGWAFADRSRTTAEVMKDLYQAIRDAAGDAYLLGCNTMGHLAAGTHEAQRTGDDTSGRNWDRNRRMAINTLAFRSPQHRTFFEVDSDIVPITKHLEWSLVEPWLELVAQGGTSLFVAADPKILEPKHKAAMRMALGCAAEYQPIVEPIDWMNSTAPRFWKVGGLTKEFRWVDRNGGYPFGD